MTSKSVYRALSLILKGYGLALFFLGMWFIYYQTTDSFELEVSGMGPATASLASWLFLGPCVSFAGMVTYFVGVYYEPAKRVTRRAVVPAWALDHPEFDPSARKEN